MLTWTIRLSPFAVGLLMYLASYVLVESDFGARLALDACRVESITHALETGKAQCLADHGNTMGWIVFAVGMSVGLALYFLYSRLGWGKAQAPLQ